MNKFFYIILVQFSSINIGQKYMSDNNIYFAFCVDDNTYSAEGDIIKQPENSSIVSYGELSIKIHKNPTPGQLFIKNGFLQYYKETQI